MIPYEQFSALRLVDLFPGTPWAQAEDRGHDWEWLGGLWDQDEVPGVEFHYPEAGAGQLGAIKIGVSVPGLGGAIGQADRSGRYPNCDENAARVLALLDVPLAFHDDMARVRAAIKALGGRILEKERAEPFHFTVLTFQCGKPQRYRFEALIHDSQGLLQLTVIRDDLARKNDMGI